MKSIQLLAASVIAGASPTSARDFRPEMWFENVLAGDESVQQCLVFPTTAGVGYRVEWSHDLTSWTSGEEVYGLGFEFAVAMREFTPPPPVPEPEPGAGDPPAPYVPPSVRVSLLFREAAGTTPGTVVSWKSLDHGGAVSRFLPLVMTGNWSQMPFFWNGYDDHDFFITRYSGSVAPPDPELPLGTMDAAMIDCLEEHFAEINSEIDASVARVRNTPPPAPPDPDSKKFWRVHCDAGIDTDLDGSPDWAEFEMAAAGTGVLKAGVSADPFAADTNGDGVPDGQQLDADGDGTADAKDTDLADAAVSFPVGPLPRYALFPIHNALPPEELPAPLQINDRGEVLYANGVWQGGSWTPLPGAEESATSRVRAVRINNHGEVIGVVTGGFAYPDGTTLSPVEMIGNVVRWPDK